MPTRRRIAFWLASLPAVTTLHLYSRQDHHGAADTFRDLLRPLRRQNAALHLGQMYLSQFPKEVSIEKLTTLIYPEAEGTSLDPIFVTKLVARRQYEDYAMGRIVEVDGWFLAHTEARVYALASLAS